MNRTINFLLGMIVGGFVGAAVAILVAPVSGEELRADINQRAERIRSDVSQAAADRRAELERQLAALKAPKQPEE